jgi:signal transduction histidine kinase
VPKPISVDTSEIANYLKEAQDLLTNQTFSQHMIECLINDLLDMGKMHQNVFKLQEEFFSLPDTIFQAF